MKSLKIPICCDRYDFQEVYFEIVRNMKNNEHRKISGTRGTTVLQARQLTLFSLAVGSAHDEFLKKFVICFDAIRGTRHIIRDCISLTANIGVDQAVRLDDEYSSEREICHLSRNIV